MAAFENPSYRSRFKRGFGSVVGPNIIRGRFQDYPFSDLTYYIPWQGWSDTSNYNAVTVWTSPTTVALSIGIILFGDGQGKDIYKFSIFKYGNVVYRVQNGLIVSII